MLSQHVNVVTARLNKTPEQINNEKSILKAIIIQALMPVICGLPTGFFGVILPLKGWDWDLTQDELTIFRYGENHEYRYTMIYLCASVASMFPILDSFITLGIVKSYRRAANIFLAKLKICRKVTVTPE